MNHPPATSPFAKTHLVPLAPGEVFQKEGTIAALRLPDGKVLFNFEQGTSHNMLKQLANILKAEIVSVKGTWTFHPLLEEEED